MKETIQSIILFITALIIIFIMSVNDVSAITVNVPSDLGGVDTSQFNGINDDDIVYYAIYSGKRYHEYFNLSTYSIHLVYSTEKFYWNHNTDKNQVISNIPSEKGRYYITYNMADDSILYNLQYSDSGGTNTVYTIGSGGDGINSYEYIDILYSNFDVYNDSGGVIYDSPEDDTYIAPSVANVSFVLPRDGFKDNSYMFNFRVLLQYPVGTNVNKVTGAIRINDNKADELGMLITNRTTRVYQTDNYTELDVGFTLVNMPYGINTISYTTFYDEVESGSAEINIERLEGFIDEDGDGLDDRTGQPDAQTPKYDFDNDKIDFTLKGAMSNAMKFFNEGKESFNFIGQVYSILPSPIPEAIAFVIVISIALFIIKIVRG